jgi:MFS family permease
LIRSRSASSRPQPSPGRPRLTPSRALTPLGLAVCLSLFGDLTLYAVLVTQLDVVGLSLPAAGVMLGVNRLVRVPGNPLAGLLLDRWGRRPLFILGMLVGVLSIVGSALVRGFWPFLLTRLAWGIAWTLINVGGLTVVLDVSTSANRGRLTGLYNTWMLAGLALGPLVGGFLVDRVGFRAGLLVCAAIAAVGLAVAFVALPETARVGGSPGPAPVLPNSTPPVAGDAGRAPPRSPVGLRRRLREAWRQQVRAVLRAHRSLALVAGLYLITQLAGEGVVLSTVSLLLQQRFGPVVSVGGLVLGVASAGGLLLALRSLLAGAVGPLAGHLSDARPGRTRSGRWSVVVASLVVGASAFGLLSCAAAWRAASLGSIVLGVVLSAFSGGAGLATLAAQVGDLAPPGREGAAMGAYAAAGDVGSMAGPFLAFALVSVVGLQSVYLLCALAFLVGLVLIWRYRTAPAAIDRADEPGYTT